MLNLGFSNELFGFGGSGKLDLETTCRPIMGLGKTKVIGAPVPLTIESGNNVMTTNILICLGYALSHPSDMLYQYMQSKVKDKDFLLKYAAEAKVDRIDAHSNVDDLGGREDYLIMTMSHSRYVWTGKDGADCPYVLIVLNYKDGGFYYGIYTDDSDRRRIDAKTLQKAPIMR